MCWLFFARKWLNSRIVNQKHKLVNHPVDWGFRGTIISWIIFVTYLQSQRFIPYGWIIMIQNGQSWSTLTMSFASRIINAIFNNFSSLINDNYWNFNVSWSCFASPIEIAPIQSQVQIVPDFSRHNYVRKTEPTSFWIFRSWTHTITWNKAKYISILILVWEFKLKHNFAHRHKITSFLISYHSSPRYIVMTE